MEAALEQYLVLARTAKGKACEALIMQAIGNPHTFVFGELLRYVEQAGVSPEYLNLLEIFTYGTLADYQKAQPNIPELTPAQLKKLKMLTLATLASEQTVLPYSHLQQVLNISSVRELEDLIIDSIYEGLINGKIDHKLSALKVMSAFGRDVRADKIPDLLSKFSNYIQYIELVEGLIERQVKNFAADNEKAKKRKAKFVENQAKAAEEAKAMLEASEKFDSGEGKEGGRKGKSFLKAFW
ncbi:unnamed protein product [Blepharisma stoltei]|uniref:PCI domain-containing protein n=1 Tax=Blepharisma stoltei TaxID=1481888 RepID=A0AAU9J5M5_9CILI|nr:unnamed protein product [Blepharisma stoltei]